MTDEIMRSLGQIEGKLGEMSDDQKDMGLRLRTVESKMDRILGWAAGAGAGAAAVVAYLKGKFFGA